VNIGFKIKILRINSKMTQSEIASKIQVTTGYISQIENNLITPSLKNLLAILKIFRISISDFFEQKINIELINKKENFLTIRNKKLKNSISYLFPNLEHNQMECNLIDLEPQGQTLIEEYNQREEFYFILEGEITFFLNQKQNFLIKGETFYLSTDKKHYLFNHSNKNSKILKIILHPLKNI
jgi:transcriptional regulator with XRE-family HTH domain